MRFKFLNIPVTILPNFWIFLIFFSNLFHAPSIEGLIISAIMMFSLLIHEWGHAVTAVHFGGKPEIILESFGGRACYDPQGMTAKHHFLITLNGPLLQSVLVVIPYFLLKMDLISPSSLMGFVMYVMMKLNLYWILLNLIPVMPLDGGYLVLHFLEKRMDERALPITASIGLIAAICVIPFLVKNGFYFFSVLVGVYAFQNIQLLRSRSWQTTPFGDLNRAKALINAQELKKGITILKKLVKSSDVQVRHLAIEALAETYNQQNASDRSYALLLTADPNHLHTGKVLLAKLAYEQKNYSPITLYAHELYEKEPTYEMALLIAKSFGWIGQAPHAGGWLHTAMQFPQCQEPIDTLVADEAFASVKHLEAFSVNLCPNPSAL